MLIKYIYVEPEDFDKYSNLIEESEKIYPESLRTEIQDYKEVIEENSCTILLYIDETYIGNIIGSIPSKIEYEEMELPFNIQLNKIMYIYNLLIIPEFQGKGYAKLLFKEFINKVKYLRIEYISGHFRQNGSYKTIKNFNPIYEKTYKNWEESNEDFVFCITKI
jgi:GNAT superfamily N-acetyltransferase